MAETRKPGAYLCMSCKWEDHAHCSREKCECDCRSHAGLDARESAVVEGDELKEFTVALLEFLSR